MTAPAPSPLPGSASTLRLLARLVARFRGHRRLAAIVLAALLIQLLAELALPALLGQAVGRMATGRGPALSWFIAAFLAVGLVRFAARLGQGVGQAYLAQRMLTELRLEFHRKMLALSFADHGQLRRGELIARGTRDIEKARSFFGDILFAQVELAVLLTGAFVMMWRATPLFALITAGMAAACVGSLVIVAPRLRQRYRAEDDAYDLVAASIQETVAGTRVVKAFGREEAEIGRFAGHVGRYLVKSFGAFDLFAWAHPSASTLFILTVPLVLAAGGALAARGVVGVGEIATALFYLGVLQPRMRALGRLIMHTQVAAASADRLYDVLDRPERIARPAVPRPLPPPEGGAGGGGRIVLEGVHFAYSDGPAVLQDVDLQIAPGETLALVGPTGSGKSTLVALLARFHDPTAGRIALDGVDLVELDPGELRRAVGFVFQETFLFSASVAETIAFGEPGAGPERLAEAARAAQALEFVRELPNGFDTVVGERGVTLSGGQRQRLAIARALLPGPRVLVLDDATSSVDSRTESALQEALLSEGGGRRRRTTIVIAQRLSTVRRADRIVVLERGRIAEAGTHEELAAGDGWYARTCESQRHDGVLVET